MDSPTFRRATARHPHDDAPDTDADFVRLSRLPEGSEREALRARLVEQWLPMAHRLARRYGGRGEASEDLAQVAALGLVKAVRAYEPERGVPFVSYAIPTVVGEIKRHFRDRTWAVHVPRRVQELRNRVRSADRDMSTGDGRAPTVAELSAGTGLSEDDVREGQGAMQSYSSLSLDAPVSDTDATNLLVDTMGGVDDGYETVLAREAVRPYLAELPERERYILYLRFFREMTQSGIAEEIGVSQMHVSRLLSGSCRQIRERVEDARSDDEADDGAAAVPAALPAAA
ncbi:SigB/SigF/SigG family RNA polymerase sigma factor [Streptomyces phytohabitans]|uniref:SigB/SigF/SigG family RNA polymerase sigma factor n=1 Tax=Streptomyces phytohabitans TaxID=1150371 RepID=UPI00345B701F